MKAVLLTLLFAASCLTTLRAAEADAAFAASAATARAKAEADLGAERQRIVEARAKRAAEVTELTRSLSEIRTRVVAAQTAAENLRPELDRLRAAGSGAESIIAQQLNRAAAALRVDRLPNGLAERAKAVANALAVVPDRFVTEARVRIAKERVQDRAGDAATVPVLRIGAARAIACGDTTASRGVLTMQNGLLLVAGPPLPAAAEAAVSDPTRVVLDVGGSWAAQTPPPRRSLWQWIEGGRLFIWPILGVGLVGVVIAVMRAIALYKLPPDRTRLDATLAWLGGDRTTPAPLALVSQTPMDRVLSIAVVTLTQGRAQREAAMDQAVLAEAPQLQHGLSLLLLLASISPLMGLLGTVTGMIDLFSVIGAQGTGNAKSLSGGISEALITTQAGMLVAVPLLVAHSLLSRAAERRIMLLEEAVSGSLGCSAGGPR